MGSSRGVLSRGGSILSGRRTAAWLSAFAVAATALVSPTLLGRGTPVERFAHRAGSVWVVSPAAGLLTLLDGASEQVVASVRVGGAGHDLGVVQAGTDAYLTDSTAGAVSRIDGATLDVSEPVTFASGDGGDVRVLSGGGELYVLDPAGARARLVDPRELRVRSDLSLAATPGPGQAVVDDAGRLWLVDEARGGLTWFDSDKHVLRDVAGPDDRLVLVQGRPVLVDTARALVQTLDAQGRPAVQSCLDVRDDDVRLLGSSTGAELYAAQSATGSLVTAAVGRDDCERVVELAAPGEADFGELVQSGPFVFVPDRASGRANVVDTRDGQVTRLDLVDPGHDVELVAAGGFVFYNDRDGEEAGVLRHADGRWSVSDAVQKFDPGTGEPPPAPTPSPQPAPAPPADAAPSPEPLVNEADPTSPPTAQRPLTPPPTGGTPRGGAGAQPSAPPPPPVPVPPTVGPITVSPAVPMLGEAATFTATASGADGATWAWSVAAGSGAPVATGADAGSFTVTLPTDQGLAFVVTLTVTTAAGAQAAPPLTVTATPSTAPTISSVTSNESVYYPYTSASLTAVHSAVPPGGTVEWSITRDGVPFAGPVPTAPGEPFGTSVGEPGLYRATVTVTVDGRSARGSVDFKVEYVCGPTLSTDVIDLRAETSRVVTVTSDCIGTNVFEVAVAPWLSAPGSVTVPQGGSGTFTVVRSTGQPPSDGDHPESVVVTYASGSIGSMQDRATVQAYRSPDLSFPFAPDGCRNMDTFGIAFFATVADDNIASVTLSVNGASYPMLDIAPPGGYRAVVDPALLGSATTWQIIAVDAFGLPSTLSGASPCW
ncbi:hypothetical protein [Cellulomonas terrae]|uniref:PKD domain-containing protein n=1 Tax=Cellulomonas terrae TaxID=311234 RepID=A0A511JM35_9CELL|nr:hypothetical protein [Cellulomonas terrae]GEL98979.1 hypothetical protein CTE05_25260 [Cellulomonas terrae]